LIQVRKASERVQLKEVDMFHSRLSGTQHRGPGAQTSQVLDEVAP
jgi:hypothetical protein